VTTPASLTVAKNARATAIGIAAPTDINYSASQLTVKVAGLPSDGTVYLAGGTTAVTNGEPLTVAQLTGLAFKPTAGRSSQSSQFTYTVSDPSNLSTSGTATLAIGPSTTLAVDQPAATSAGTAPSGSLTNPNPDSSSGVSVVDTTTGKSVSAAAVPYSGPIAGLQYEYIYTGADNVNITVTSDNWFLKGGPGEDALQAFGGYNVLDGSTGSNLLTGGNGGTNTFLVDDRSPSADVWSTVNNFHQGDDATVFGIVNSPAIQWFDNQGAPGFTGLTLHVFGQNAPTASLTLAGYSSADLGNGRLTVQFGNATDGTPFMHIIGTG
jgi:hypothetical protein